MSCPPAHHHPPPAIHCFTYCKMRSFIAALLALALAAVCTEAFAPAPFLGRSAVSSATELEACRVNAKKEKRQRNRENMRKFSKRGRTSRKKMMRKVASQQARQEENEFLAKCFMTVPAPEAKDEGSR